MKIIIPALILSALLTGCSTPPQKLSDIELCEEAGKALYAHDGERFKELTIEAERRDALHLTVDISVGKCEQYMQIGEMGAQQIRESRKRLGNTLSAFGQSTQQQAINNANRPVTTTCTEASNSATCTTW